MAQASQSTNPTAVVQGILTELQTGDLSSRELAVKLAIDEASLIFAIQTLTENKQIRLEVSNRYTLY
jgi:hypothetical protein